MTQDAFRLAKRMRLSLDNHGGAIVSDAELLKRFLVDRQDEVFAQLVQRHGPMVWGLCQRLLHHHADGEDAFQATFLTLFQHAGRIHKQTSLASWLYGVACRIACKIKRTRVRAQQRELRLARTEEQTEETSWDQAIRDIMDAELARLPAHYREPLLLCYLQGQSQALAAQTLGWPIGTVAGRLSRAKELLRSRLIRRGVAPAVAAGMSFELAQAHLPSELIAKTLHTIHSGGTSTVSLLTKGVVTTMLLTKWLTAGAFGIALTLGAGWYYSAFSMQGDGKKEAATWSAPAPAKQNKEQSDYQLIQGQWRCETKHEVTGTLQSVEDLTFRGRKYARSTYKVEKGIVGERNYESDALDYVLDPNQSPRRMELQEVDSKETRRVSDPPEKGIERLLCTYQLSGDELTIHYGGHVPYEVNKQGKVIPDRNSPQATFPKPGDANVRTLVYRRQTPAIKKANVDEPIEKVISEAEQKLLEEQVKACEELVKLALREYMAGKLTREFYLTTIKKRAEAKLDLAGNNHAAMRVALNEALEAAKEGEAIANAKYQAGSGTLLDLTAAKVDRLNYELRLLRLEKAAK
ncbi:MAG TPA: sigma-70 family RNA polymerase sigma factor [Gemmatales bacterium]|nr:sigma-70 family RNA polymerase sigma factor [Gemmatales bacterium]